MPCHQPCGEIDLSLPVEGVEQGGADRLWIRGQIIQLLAAEPLELMVVIGGYNSSNTANLARICAESRPTFHIADPDCLLSRDEIRHRPVGSKAETVTNGWLPPVRPLSIGLTSGASTPDNLVGAAIAKLEAFCA